MNLLQSLVRYLLVGSLAQVRPNIPNKEPIPTTRPSKNEVNSLDATATMAQIEADKVPISHDEAIQISKATRAKRPGQVGGSTPKFSEEFLLECAYKVKCMVGSYPKSNQGPWSSKWKRATEAVNMPSKSVYTYRFGRLAIAWDRAEQWGKAYEERLKNEGSGTNSGNVPEGSSSSS